MMRGTLVYRERPFLRRLRRLFDVCIAAGALAIAFLPLTVACLAIYAEDRGPLFFLQRRVGRFGKTFTIYKLRTMKVVECADRPSPAAAGDPRVTRAGRVLRRLSVDELPQLLNVLRGEMSLVGPRPEMPFIVARYERWQHLRHLVTPGLTCIWQTACRSTIPLDRPEATTLDIEYIRRASPFLDGALIARTITTLISPRGAY